MPNTEITPTSTSIETAIATVEVTPVVVETSSFQAVLQQIPLRVREANTMLEDYRRDPDAFLDAVDEDMLDSQLKEMATVSGFVRDIERGRKDIKKYMDARRDEMLAVLDDRLEGAQFKELERAQADIKQLKKDVDADRREKRWAELRETFKANVERYPLLSEYAPELADFSRFKMHYPKLVSGAKTRVIREADHTVINETVYAWNAALEMLVGNEWGLAPNDLNQLLTLFKANPSIETVTREGRQLKQNAEAREKARLEAEARRIEQERAAKAEAEKRQRELEELQRREAEARKQRDVEAQKRAEAERIAQEERMKRLAEEERQRQQSFQQFGGSYPTVFKESHPLFMEYLFSRPDYHDIHSSAATKANVIYDVMRQIEDGDSVVSRETHRDPQKVLDLVRYLLDA